MPVVMTPDQEDYIAELMNIAMGQAASSMSEMIDEEVQLAVPKISFVPRQYVIDQFFDQVKGDLTGVSQSIEGGLKGESLLLFPGEKSLSVVEMLMQNTVSVDGLAELEQEALCEIGNILLNAVNGSLADNIGETLISSLPKYIYGDSNHILPARAAADEAVLLMQVDFSFSRQMVKGYVVILLEVESIDTLLNKVDNCLRKHG